MKRANECCWTYLFRAEDSSDGPRGGLTQTEPSRLLGACKTLLWLGVSILVGVGVSRLG